MSDFTPIHRVVMNELGYKNLLDAPGEVGFPDHPGEFSHFFIDIPIDSDVERLEEALKNAGYTDIKTYIQERFTKSKRTKVLRFGVYYKEC